MGFLKDYFDSIGLGYEVYEPEKGVITLYLSVGGGDVDYLHLNGHVDVVPIGEESRWSVDPFGGEIRDGYIFGRGSSDMKAGVAVAIKVFEVLARYWEDIPHRVGLSIVPDEETGSRLGTRYLIREVGLRPRNVLIGEPSTVDMLEIGEKGIYQYSLRVHGFPSHASLSPYIGDNAIMKAYRIADELYSLTQLTFTPPEDLADVVESSGEIVASHFNKPELRRLYKSLTCNVGLIRGGDKVNVVAPWAEMDVDMRIPPGLTIDRVRELIRDRLSSYEGHYEMLRESGHDPSVTDRDAGLVRAILEAGREILGREPRLHLVAGATDCRIFREVGSDAVIYGPGDPGRIHSYDEYVKIDDIKACGRVWLMAAYKLLVG